MDYSFSKEIDDFRKNIDSIWEIYPSLMIMLTSTFKKQMRQAYNIMDKYAVGRKKTKDNTVLIAIPSEKYDEIEKNIRMFERFRAACKLTPRTFIVSIVSQYDAFVGRLIRGIFFSKPEVLDSSQKPITYSSLVSFGSFEDAREYIIEEEIDGLLRKSHDEQFSWLENKMGISLRKNLDIWKEFIEITERRNLFVHCNGIVSKSYLEVCKRNGVIFEKKRKIGEELDVNPEYFRKAYRCFLEVGVKLGQVIWRKLLPGEIEEADKQLNNLCVDLINEEEYIVAEKLLELAIAEFSRRSTEQLKLYYKFNLAQTYKWKGEIQKCEEILSKIDISTLSDEYQLSDAVLKDNFEKASQIMRQIGKKGKVSEIDYRIWPIFKEFRKNNIFERTYEEIFGQRFQIETKPTTEQICIDFEKSMRKKKPEKHKKISKKVKKKKAKIKKKKEK